MLIPTTQQQEQIDQFFHLITTQYERIILHPIIDEKTGTERLGICVVDHLGKDKNNIYLLGVWFLPGDKLFNRFTFKESEGRIVTVKLNGVMKWLTKVRKTILHLLD